MMVVGITGGIGVGKTYVSKLFSGHGVPVYEADFEAKQLMVQDQSLILEIKALIGAEAYDNEGNLNRAFIAQQIFTFSEKKKMLEDIIHPRVFLHFENWVKQNHRYSYVIKESALLFETDGHKKVDKIITVSAPKELRIKRVLSRDTHRSIGDIEGIIAKQLDEEVKLRSSDFVIINDDTISVADQVAQVHQHLLEMSDSIRFNGRQNFET